MYGLSDLFVIFLGGFCLGMRYGDCFGYNVWLAVIMAVGATACTIYSIVRFCKEITNINDEKDNN